MNNETWLPVKGYEGIYEASNLGRLKALEKTQSHYKGGTMTRREKILKTDKPHRTGYANVRLCGNDIKMKHHAVHRLIAEAFISNPNGYAEVNHKDGNKLNNAVDNLEWCTRKQNQEHAIKINLWTPIVGERHGNSVLKETDVLKMRELHEQHKYRKSQIAKLFNVSKGTAGKIIKRESWAHV